MNAREIELLEVIEKMRGKISSAKEFALYEVVEQLLDDALALTPDLLALKDSEGWCPHGVSLNSHCTKCGF